MEGESSNKRFRDDSDESPEAKRLRADLLLDILDDDDTDAGDRDPAVHDPPVDDLASVMRSFEEEIALAPPEVLDPVELSADQDDLRQHDLGYLLEASDDELGLPPTVPSSSDEGLEAEAETDSGVVAGVEAESEPAGFGRIWGFDDEIPGCYDGMGYGIRPFVGGEGVVFDDGLFNYGGGLSDTSDYSESTWRPESMPAV